MANARIVGQQPPPTGSTYHEQMLAEWQAAHRKFKNYRQRTSGFNQGVFDKISAEHDEAQAKWKNYLEARNSWNKPDWDVRAWDSDLKHRESWNQPDWDVRGWQREKIAAGFNARNAAYEAGVPYAQGPINPGQFGDGEIWQVNQWRTDFNKRKKQIGVRAHRAEREQLRRELDINISRGLDYRTGRQAGINTGAPDWNIPEWESQMRNERQAFSPIEFANRSIGGFGSGQSTPINSTLRGSSAQASGVNNVEPDIVQQYAAAKAASRNFDNSYRGPTNSWRIGAESGKTTPWAGSSLQSPWTGGQLYSPWVPNLNSWSDKGSGTAMPSRPRSEIISLMDRFQGAPSTDLVPPAAGAWPTNLAGASNAGNIPMAAKFSVWSPEIAELRRNADAVRPLLNQYYAGVKSIDIFKDQSPLVRNLSKFGQSMRNFALSIPTVGTLSTSLGLGGAMSLGLGPGLAFWGATEGAPGALSYASRMFSGNMPEDPYDVMAEFAEQHHIFTGGMMYDEAGKVTSNMSMKEMAAKYKELEALGGSDFKRVLDMRPGERAARKGQMIALQKTIQGQIAGGLAHGTGYHVKQVGDVIKQMRGNVGELKAHVDFYNKAHDQMGSFQAKRQSFAKELLGADRVEDRPGMRTTPGRRVVGDNGPELTGRSEKQDFLFMGHAQGKIGANAAGEALMEPFMSTGITKEFSFVKLKEVLANATDAQSVREELQSMGSKIFVRDMHGNITQESKNRASDIRRIMNLKFAPEAGAVAEAGSNWIGKAKMWAKEAGTSMLPAIYKSGIFGDAMQTATYLAALEPEEAQFLMGKLSAEDKLKNEALQNRTAVAQGVDAAQFTKAPEPSISEYFGARKRVKNLKRQIANATGETKENLIQELLLERGKTGAGHMFAIGVGALDVVASGYQMWNQRGDSLAVMDSGITSAWMTSFYGTQMGQDLFMGSIKRGAGIGGKITSSFTPKWGFRSARDKAHKQLFKAAATKSFGKGGIIANNVLNRALVFGEGSLLKASAKGVGAIAGGALGIGVSLLPGLAYDAYTFAADYGYQEYKQKMDNYKTGGRKSSTAVSEYLMAPNNYSMLATERQRAAMFAKQAQMNFHAAMGEEATLFHS